MTEHKYSRGKIYKLVSSQTQDVYYGSTIEDKLTNRLAGHRKGYKRWLDHKYNFSTSFEIIKFDDCKIILVENLPCNSIYELLAREQYHLNIFRLIKYYPIVFMRARHLYRLIKPTNILIVTGRQTGMIL